MQRPTPRLKFRNIRIIFAIVAKKAPGFGLLFVDFAQTFVGGYVVQNLADLLWTKKTGSAARQRDKVSS